MVQLIKLINEEIVHPKELKFGQLAEIMDTPTGDDIHKVVQRHENLLIIIGTSDFYDIRGLESDSFLVRILLPGEQIKVTNN